MRVRTLIAAAALGAGLSQPAPAEESQARETGAPTPVLTVYTYDSFASDWGPGPVIEKGLEEGHYLQMELAKVTAASEHPALARRFIAYLIGPEAQAAIPTTNWMFPVNPRVELPDAFDTLVRPERTLAFPAERAAAQRKGWIREWLAVMGE